MSEEKLPPFPYQSYEPEPFADPFILTSREEEFFAAWMGGECKSVSKFYADAAFDFSSSSSDDRVREEINLQASVRIMRMLESINERLKNAGTP